MRSVGFFKSRDTLTPESVGTANKSGKTAVAKEALRHCRRNTSFPAYLEDGRPFLVGFASSAASPGESQFQVRQSQGCRLMFSKPSEKSMGFLVTREDISFESCCH